MKIASGLLKSGRGFGFERFICLRIFGRQGREALAGFGKRAFCLFLLGLLTFDIGHDPARFALMACEQLGSRLSLCLKTRKINLGLTQLAGNFRLGITKRLNALASFDTACLCHGRRPRQGLDGIAASGELALCKRLRLSRGLPAKVRKEGLKRGDFLRQLFVFARLAGLTFQAFQLALDLS